MTETFIATIHDRRGLPIFTTTPRTSRVEAARAAFTAVRNAREAATARAIDGKDSGHDVRFHLRYNVLRSP